VYVFIIDIEVFVFLLSLFFFAVDLRHHSSASLKVIAWKDTSPIYPRICRMGNKLSSLNF